MHFCCRALSGWGPTSAYLSPDFTLLGRRRGDSFLPALCSTNLNLLHVSLSHFYAPLPNLSIAARGVAQMKAWRVTDCGAEAAVQQARPCRFQTAWAGPFPFLPTPTRIGCTVSLSYPSTLKRSMYQQETGTPAAAVGPGESHCVTTLPTPFTPPYPFLLAPSPQN